MHLHLNNHVTANKNLNKTIVITKTDDSGATIQILHFYAFFSASIKH